MHAVHQEAAGVVEVSIISPAMMSDLFAAALRGDPEAVRLAGATSKVITQVSTAPRSRPMLCLSCPRPLRRRDSFSCVIAVPSVDNPTMAVGAALCVRCAGDSGGPMAKALVGLRRMWPEARSITLGQHAAGRA